MMKPCIGKRSMQVALRFCNKPFLEHQLIDAIEKAVPYDRTARKQNVVGIVRRY